MRPSTPSTTSAERGDAMLSPHFDALRAIPAVDSFPLVRAWLDQAMHSQRAERRVQPPRFARSLFHHPLRFVTGVLVLAAACSVPVAQEETLAYIISGRIAEPPATARTTLAGIPWVNPEHLTVLGEVTWKHPDGTETVEAYVESGEAVVDGRKIITPTSKFALVLPHSDARQAEARARVLSGVKGVISVVQEPVQERVRRPAIQAALVAMELEFSAPVPESTVERRISEHLAGLSMSGVEVHFVTGRNGSRVIRLSGPGMISSSESDARRINAFIKDVQSHEELPAPH